MFELIDQSSNDGRLSASRSHGVMNGHVARSSKWDAMHLATRSAGREAARR
jgi:hypothetical protein